LNVKGFRSLHNPREFFAPLRFLSIFQLPGEEFYSSPGIVGLKIRPARPVP
jgi:hypothetical protein